MVAEIDAMSCVMEGGSCQSDKLRETHTTTGIGTSFHYRDIPARHPLTKTLPPALRDCHYILYSLTKTIRLLFPRAFNQFAWKGNIPGDFSPDQSVAQTQDQGFCQRGISAGFSSWWTITGPNDFLVMTCGQGLCVVHSWEDIADGVVS